MSWSPTTAPHGAFDIVYLVLDSFGARGTAYRETDVERTDLETVIAGRGSSMRRFAWWPSTCGSIV